MMHTMTDPQLFAFWNCECLCSKSPEKLTMKKMDKKNMKDHLSMLFRITEFKEANCLNALLKRIMF